MIIQKEIEESSIYAIWLSDYGLIVNVNKFFYSYSKKINKENVNFVISDLLNADISNNKRVYINHLISVSILNVEAQRKR